MSEASGEVKVEARSAGERKNSESGSGSKSSKSSEQGKNKLQVLLQSAVEKKPFSELFDVSLDHSGAELIGDALLDTLEKRGFALDAFDAVGALTAAAVPMVTAVTHAAHVRGRELDGFVMDFVYPSIKGPSISGKRVVLLDSWLSEKSYVQTSSLVTLRNGNELSLDFSVVEHEGAQVVAIASLIGGVSGDADASTIKVINPVSGEKCNLPFARAFDEDELRGNAPSAVKKAS
ncbi:orotate phosphoribosyltransferase [Bifidobacterium sp. ESL0745]|uniref:orotate phosphoribosyltransferase n=1 Tax=Bifidobacterium sp. ESL0745 TaxID=2983226 RepID=UPI0023F9C062|nr:orotate phosphoribosyltransferase [Bifidobacterium sp. ESL0745]MDF7665672.1 orotate phosphoribosyltransferase [Bifidobacterium sp. ESL0745]